MSEQTTDEWVSFNGKVYDCAIVGAGPAGLSAAIYMGRMRRSVVVVDDREGRSTWHQVNRNYLGFPNGVHATALREIGREQALRYGVEFLTTCASGVQYTGEPGREKRRFRLATGKGDIVCRTLILAMGVHDRFPEFEGSMECIGRTMFWCIICDGYEAIDRRIVVLGHGDRAAALALQLLLFTDEVTLVSWDDPLSIEPKRRRALDEHGVKVYDCSCAEYVCHRPGQLASIKLETGDELELDMLFVAQHIEPNNELAKQLELRLDEHGYIVVDAEQLTNVPGVYAAGDITKLFNHQVTSAVHEGGMAAAAANYYLYEEWQKE